MNGRILVVFVRSISMTVGQKASNALSAKSGAMLNAQCQRKFLICSSKSVMTTRRQLTKKLVLNGLVGYICNDCSPLIQCSSEHSIPETTDEVQGAKVDSLPKESVEQEGQEPRHSVPTYKSSQLLCIEFKRGRCQLGISGRKVINGNVCKYLHPKVCLRYSRHGNQGCQGSCNFFHPILCRNSVRYKKCYQKDCTFTHLSGTERKKIRFLQHPNSYGQQNFHQVHQPNFTSTPPFYPVNGNKWKNHTNQIENLEFNNKNFPTLYNSQYNKIDEMSSAIMNMQRCITKLMQHSFPENNPRPTGTDTTSHGVQNTFQTQWTNSCPYPSNQHTNHEAKNLNNPNFL